MAKDISYKEASLRLDEILRYIEGENPDVDELQEAVELTKLCRNRLTEADKQFEALMASLDESSK